MTSVRDRLEDVFSRIGEPLPVFTKLYRDEARAEADAADGRRKAGISLGPLDGKLVTIKDLFDVAGEVTTAGSIILRDRPPAERDALVVNRLRQAGAVILGKTNMTEFAFSGLGLNPHYGNPGNAVDPARISGGSSSGAGVAVAQGFCDIAIGSDTGGSVRIPAAFNNIVGFKPTAFRIPKDGAFPLSYTLDSIGPLAGRVADCALADAVMAGDISGLPENARLDGLRFAVPGKRLLSDMDEETRQAFERAVSLLTGAGVHVFEHNLDDLLLRMAEATAKVTIASAEASEIHAKWLESRTAEFDQRVSSRILIARNFSAAEYIHMLRLRSELVREMDMRLADVDAVIAPTVAVTPPPMKLLQENDELYFAANAIILRNTTMANVFDLTAITLPVPETRLPVGLMLMARHGADRRLLSIARSVEEWFF